MRALSNWLLGTALGPH